MRTHNAAAQSRRDSIAEARNTVFDDLTAHDLYCAALALTRSATSAYNDFFNMRRLLLAGGLHCQRLTGGRSIDRAGR